MLTAASQHHSNKPHKFIVMGVAGSGKTSIGEGVAEQVSGRYIDGDNLHPQVNINKMSRGEPLNDEDRWPWLEAVGNTLASMDGIGLIGCSALKKSYRDLITQKVGGPVTFLYLDGSKELIAKRMAAREGHFMPTSLLDSQFATLEVPTAPENFIAINIEGTQAEIITAIVSHIQDI